MIVWRNMLVALSVLLIGVHAGSVVRAASYEAALEQTITAADRGDFDLAAAAAREAFGAATTTDQKREAARLVAGAYFQNGQYFSATWWLRRAANFSYSSETTQGLARDFAVVKAKNPVSARLSLAITPSSNINSGAESGTFFLGDFEFILDPSSVALSGIEYAGDIALSYRIGRSEKTETELGLYAYARTFSLSPSSRDSAPDVSGSDFALSLVEASISQRNIIFDATGPTATRFQMGRVWYAGSPVWDYARASLGQNFGITAHASAYAEVAFETQRSRDGIQPDAEVLDLKASYARRLANKDILRFELKTRMNDASIDTFTFQDTNLSATYDFAEPVWGSRLSLNAGLGHKVYDVFSLSLNGRHDNYVQLGLMAVFERFSYFGFSPSLTLNGEARESNVTRFTNRSLQLGFGLESVF